MENIQDKRIFNDTEDFVATLKNNKSAIYSVKENKYITDFVFDKIAYIKNGNYFIVQKDKDIFSIDTNGNRRNFPRLCPNQCFRVEVLAHRRFINGLHSISNGKKVGVIDRNGNMIIPFIYKTIRQDSEGAFTAQTFDNKKVCIDKTGKILEIKE
jgi:hypothetical protein